MNEEIKPHKVYVAGTGRSGTTFLMIIFTLLGLDTGFDINTWERGCYAECNGVMSGMERSTPMDDVYIIKQPGFISKVEELVHKVNIDFMIIPIRDYNESARSRETIGSGNAGGLWNASNFEEQKIFYYTIISEYLLSMVNHSIPTIFISFERMVNDKKYLFNTLKPFLKKENIKYSDFERAYDTATSHQTGLKNLRKNRKNPNNAIRWKKNKWEE
jgi:hypothetical protein